MSQLCRCRLKTRLSLLESVLKSRKPSCGHLQNLYADTYGDLLLTEEQLTANVLAFVEYWAGENLVPGPNKNVLKMWRNPMNEDKYIPIHRAWFQKLVTESIGAVKDY